MKIEEITDEFVELNPGEVSEPDSKNHEIYKELQGLQNGLSASLLDVFKGHRRFVLR